ncbi:MAG: hypothetical protein HC927_05295 [Deltaproteobacteria bacterium]|nr:hypothetical protein [Deltaproteobacteria bacterium]
MGHDILLKCRCGAVTGMAREVSSARGNRLVCMCDDCQAYARWLGDERMLDQSGGTEVFQLTPAQVRIDRGREQVRCVRLSEQGLMRWYADCCRTPIANTLASPRMPFVGVLTLFMDHPDPRSRDEQLGPVLARIQARFGKPPLPPGSHLRAPLGLILRSLGQLVRGFIAGAHAPSPFFDPSSGAPIVEPLVLDSTERDRLRM